MDNGIIRSERERVVHEGNNEMSMRDEELNGEKGFTGDLNGAQFPLINGMDGNKNGVNEGVKDCLDKKSRCHSGSGNKDNADGNEAMNRGNDTAISKNEGVGEVNEKEESDNNSATKFFAKNLVDIVNSSRLDNKLINVPTRVGENGDDVVIFDDEIIELGSKKWNLIDEEGIKEVINNGPWMVNNKPMIVQKWSIDMCIDKAEPKKLPVCVKMMNVPMEPWSVKGISALASSIGKPIIMDEVTTKMCVTGVGRIGFARVLVEIDAEKGIKDRIEIMYISKDVTTGTKKSVDVEYS
ncbi:RNA-directed DNA polymerase, eukaryota, reverse transcriptase zinc-binding domain protein [Tanacetum coccineum]|uniref:RNA-directed DNA polymerase, eukaryota, reverse transcriptase zinc-binding domain protein n=1 Tax=Tanacetum coccineum TaxID=301880 RepID=A0ABQ5F4V4_9ASTR